ncbi:MAG: ferritin-like domain-containing protein [Candidatus Aminicenantales bacterium]
MEKVRRVDTEEDAIHLLQVALEHEWAVSFEYTIHAYSMPKGKFFYEDPVMKLPTDARAQIIQIGIDEMYHSLQLGIIIRQMGGDPSFKSDEVIRYPKVLDNLKRDKLTEDLVTDLYQSAEWKEGAFPKIQNMALNISYDEVRHGRQFQTMIRTMEQEGAAETLCFQENTEAAAKPEVRLLHEITRMENELMHRYLRFVFLFSEHQDLSQRLFKNSINHMRHWDKNSGILVKLGSVIRIENSVREPDGKEISRSPMPSLYSGRGRLSALHSLIPAEEELITKYEKLVPLIPEGEIRNQLSLQLGLKREHLFTQEWLLKNAGRIKGLS